MDKKTRFQAFGLQSALRVTAMACLAMGFTLACSGTDDGSTDEMDHAEESDAVHGQNETVLDKAKLANLCQNCEHKVVCESELVSCSPPLFVDGHEVKCLEQVCREERVCTPCDDNGPIDDGLDGIDLGGVLRNGGFSPVDPLPFAR